MDTAGLLPVGAPATPRAQDLSLVDGLVQLSFHVYGLISRLAAARDLSVVQVRMLGALRDRELRMAQLAALLNLDKSSVTGLIDRAERRGLVRRVPVPEDGRAVHVVLTRAGQDLAATMAAEVSREVADVTGGLSETGRRKLASLAGQVVHQAAAAAGLDLSAGQIPTRSNR